MKTVAFATATILGLTGCVNDSQLADLQAKVTDLQTKVVDLRAEVAELKSSNEREEIDNLRQKLEWVELMQSISKIAYLTPGATGYATVQFDLGALTLKIDDIQPFANGSKATLRIGNLLSSKINGLQVTIEWGEVDKKGYAINDKAKSKKLTLAETLGAGAWTRVSVVLEGVKAENLGFIRVRDISHRGIELIQTWK